MYFAHARLDRQRQCCLGKTAWQVIACAITKQMTSNDQTRRCRTSLQANLCKLRRLKLQSGLQVAKGWNVLALGNLDVAKNLDHKVQKIVEVMYVERLLVLLCSTPAWCQGHSWRATETQAGRDGLEGRLKSMCGRAYPPWLLWLWELGTIPDVLTILHHIAPESIWDVTGFQRQSKACEDIRGSWDLFSHLSHSNTATVLKINWKALFVAMTDKNY